jgi:hypothetical protein
MRQDPAAIEFGLDEFREPHWQTVAGMLKTPFVDPHRHEVDATAEERELVSVH